jgi:hypothetical protein
MDAASFLRHFRRELDAFGACLAEGDLTAPIEHGEEELNLAELAALVGSANLFAAAAVTDWDGSPDPPDAGPPKVPEDRYELTRWVDGTGEALLMALDTDPGSPAWGYFTPPNAGYWQRSRAVAMMLHRWDAQRAVAEPGPLDPALAGEGISEVFDVLAPADRARQGLAAGRVRPAQGHRLGRLVGLRARRPGGRRQRHGRGPAAAPARAAHRGRPGVHLERRPRDGALSAEGPLDLSGPRGRRPR